jgi:hypothetical protein
MAEEPRFFVRIALYVVVAGTIYWYVSYERAGSLLFAFLAGGALLVAAGAGRIVRAGRSGERSRDGLLAALDRTVGFGSHPGDESAGPLDIEPEPVPPRSSWPALGAAAFLLVGLGLLYGAWFWLPGAVLAAVAAWGWTTELSR